MIDAAFYRSSWTFPAPPSGPAPALYDCAHSPAIWRCHMILCLGEGWAQFRLGAALRQCKERKPHLRASAKWRSALAGGLALLLRL